MLLCDIHLDIYDQFHCFIPSCFFRWGRVPTAKRGRERIVDRIAKTRLVFGLGHDAKVFKTQSLTSTGVTIGRYPYHAALAGIF